MNKNPQTMRMNVDMNLAEDIRCDACESISFVSCYLIKKLSPVISPTGKETIIPVETFACNACGNINQEFMPTMIAQERE